MALPKLAVWKFASCDGCQLSLLDCEDELLSLVGKIQIANFPEASRAVLEGPYDLSLVEGSVTTPEEVRKIKEIREQSRVLISIGACATAGGIQALRNFKKVTEFISLVYAHPEYIETLDKALPISEYVKVDFELRGCPISKHQLLEILKAFLFRTRPSIPNHSVCVECKRKGIVCLMVSKSIPCLGPVTQAGCDALCPSFHRGCFGCFGPKENANPSSLSDRWKGLGASQEELLRVYRTFNICAPAFQKESEKYE